MGLFSAGDKKKEQHLVETIISVGTEVHGTIRTKGLLRVDGSVDGGVTEADGVIVGEGGKIKGDIKAKTVIVGGRVTGHITVSQSLEMQAKAQVYGDIKAPSLSIAEGVMFEGNCTMTSDRGKVIELDVSEQR